MTLYSLLEILQGIRLGSMESILQNIHDVFMVFFWYYGCVVIVPEITILLVLDKQS